MQITIEVEFASWLQGVIVRANNDANSGVDCEIPYSALWNMSESELCDGYFKPMIRAINKQLCINRLKG